MLGEQRLVHRLRRPRPQKAWMPGNRIELLENGEEYFPAVFQAIEQARREVLIETFILFEDKVGKALQRVLIDAAQRGVSVDVLVDGFGSPDLSPEFIGALGNAGVRLRAFDPRPRLFGIGLWNPFRRMHRKIVVVDGEVAFVGGINFSADHLGDFGPEAKQDYSVRIHGPIVGRIQEFVRAQIKPHAPWPPAGPQRPAGEADMMFVVRDNLQHLDDIERQYRAAVRAARREVIIANAYFFPGYRLLKVIRQAARRGVRVRLILQGQPDMAFVKTAAEMLHRQLVPAGVEIHEYCERPLHGKVALVDDTWATVGSSNLDPLSLSLNLEANVMTRDRAFIAHLRERLDGLIRQHCRQVEVSSIEKRGRWGALIDHVAYYVTRRFPTWARWFPRHRPALAPLEAPAVGVAPTTTTIESAERTDVEGEADAPAHAGR